MDWRSCSRPFGLKRPIEAARRIHSTGIEAAIVKNIGRNCGFAAALASGAGALPCQSLAAPGFVKKLSFFSKILLTMNGGPAYKPLTNEGGGAAGDRRTRSEVSYESLVRIVGFRRERFGSWR